MNLNIGPIFFLLLLPITKSSNLYSWQPRETPVNTMTDVVNDLGLKILNCYSSSHQHGNVAFSPTGLAFVLTALYEAAAGNTRHQIAHLLGLPQDKRIIRIGLRDVHRRLRSYLNANAFLGGLTLNRDDISLRPEYEDILTFYGFDLINSTLATTTSAPSTNSTEPLTLSTEPSISQLNSTSDSSDSSSSTTTSPEVEILSDQTDQGPNTTDVTSSTTPLPTEESSIPTATDNLLTESTTASTEIENVTSSSTEPTVASIESQNTTPMIRKRRSGDQDSNLPSEFNLSTEMSSESSSELSAESHLSWWSLYLPTKFNIFSFSSSKSTPLPTEPSSLQKSTRLPQKLMNLPTDDLPSIPTAPVKRRRSTGPDFQNWLPDVNPWQPSLDVDGIAVDFDNSEFKSSELNFFTDGVDFTSISTVMYTTVLPFCYFPSLGTAVVEFPLDDPRYTVVILLPDRDVGTLVKTLSASGVKLRKLRQALTPCWVQAAIPSFMLKGFVTLTGWLQKLGIIDAFEPRAADLSLMTPDLGVYARDVHQSIGVNIRNFEPEGANFTLKGNPRGEPIPFIADRPFIFLIIDTETSVSLIAGRVNDPLNSRII